VSYFSQLTHILFFIEIFFWCTEEKHVHHEKGLHEGVVVEWRDFTVSCFQLCQIFMLFSCICLALIWDYL
jgi:hypothetical protein